jgi:hypothetical protein
VTDVRQIDQAECGGENSCGDGLRPCHGRILRGWRRADGAGYFSRSAICCAAVFFVPPSTIN